MSEGLPAIENVHDMLGKIRNDDYDYAESKKERIDKSKNNTRYYGCGESGNWARDCPKCGKRIYERK